MTFVWDGVTWLLVAGSGLIDWDNLSAGEGDPALAYTGGVTRRRRLMRR